MGKLNHGVSKMFNKTILVNCLLESHILFASTFETSQISGNRQLRKRDNMSRFIGLYCPFLIC